MLVLPSSRRSGQRAMPFEAAAAVKAYGKDVLGISRLVAITNSDNESSIKLLEKIGLRFERMIRLSEDAPEIKLFASDV